jgi:hypothetical protein
MLGWLLRYEAFPEKFTRSLAGYRSLLSRDVLLEDSWMRILFNDAPIGYSHTHLDVDEFDAMRRYVVFNEVELHLKVMGQAQSISVETEARIDATHKLQAFSFELTSRNYALRLEAERGQGDRFDVDMRTGREVQRFTLDIPDDVIIYSPMTEMALRELEPGGQLRIRTLDPASLATADVVVKALRHEPLVLGGVTNDTTVVTVTYQGLDVLSWIGRDGTVLKQATPFGWTLEKCTPQEAFRALKDADGSGDILAAMAVPCKGAIPRPRTRRQLDLRLTGVPFTREELASERIRVLELTPAYANIRVSAAALPTPPVEPPDTSALAPYLAATMAVQADHPKLRKRAEAITEGLTDPWERAEAIFDWVHKHVRKEMTVSLPSALDVLARLEGDCNEHTYLYVGLARAAGIPAKIVVGLAYQDGAFYYHAWPAVFVGRWHELDPTWGQKRVDPTHLPLVEGELADQIRLARVMGRLKIEVLGATPDD